MHLNIAVIRQFPSGTKKQAAINRFIIFVGVRGYFIFSSLCNHSIDDTFFVKSKLGKCRLDNYKPFGNQLIDALNSVYKISA